MNRLPFILLAICVFLDQSLKAWASASLSMHTPRIMVPSMLEFQLVHNYGAAYGILQNQRLLLLGVGITVVGLFFFFHKQIMTSRWSNLGFSFFMAGAIGNIIDRFRLGYVIDFVNIHIFPVFNFADVLIDIGIACFVMDLISSGSFRRSK